jgi:hypothetical protein
VHSLILIIILKATRSGRGILGKVLRRVYRELQILQGLGNDEVSAMYIETVVELKLGNYL